MKKAKRAKLVLENGVVMEGISFGDERSVAGEVVFNTGMTGYPESLTNPSYTGQILVASYPMIGNYGIPAMESNSPIHPCFESEKIQVSGLVVTSYSEKFSHWNAAMSLGAWLKRHRIPALYDIDTRALTRILREEGSMPGKIEFEGNPVEFKDPNRENLVAVAGTPVRREYGNGSYRIILVDCGVKNSIIRCLLKRNTTVIRVPWNDDFREREEYDGIVLSNGPGDPAMCVETVGNVRKLLGDDKPIMGICLGNQLLARSAGAETYKLKYGHRGQSQPVLMVGTNQCFITSQNHGYAVVPDTLPGEWEPCFINANDQTNEGIRHRSKPYFSVQFHPEASSGPMDTEFLFDDFISSVSLWKEKRKKKI